MSEGFIIHLGLDTDTSSKLTAAIKACLDGKPDNELWGSHEMASMVGYSYAHFIKEVGRASTLKDYMDLAPGRRKTRLFGSPEAIARYRKLKHGDQQDAR